MAAASSSDRVQPLADHVATGMTRQYHARWRAWEKAQPTQGWLHATWVGMPMSPEQKKQRRACWYGKPGDHGPQQANLSLWRGDTTLEAMYARLKKHSVVIQSSVDMLKKWGPRDDHESPYKYHFELLYGFALTIGYSRYGDGAIGRGWTHAWAAFGANCDTRLRKEMAIDVLLELTGHHPLFCHHHEQQEHRQRLWREKKPDSERQPHVPAPIRQIPRTSAFGEPASSDEVRSQEPAGDEVRSQQPPAVAPADNTSAVVQPTQPLAGQVADEVAVEGLTQQLLHVTLASPQAAVVQSVEPLADAVADEGVAQKPPEVTQASAPAATETTQPLAGLGFMVSLSRWGVQKCAHWFSDMDCPLAAQRVSQEGIDGQLLEELTSTELIELGVDEEKAHDVYQEIQKLSKKNVSWALQVEQEEEELEVAKNQPLAIVDLVAGEDYNDESNDVEVGSERDLSDGEREAHNSEAEDIAFMREVRAVRRIYAR